MASLFTVPDLQDHSSQTQTPAANLRCPKCRRHRNLQRVQQAKFIRFFIFFLPLRTYQCDRCAHKFVRLEAH